LSWGRCASRRGIPARQATSPGSRADVTRQPEPEWRSDTILLCPAAGALPGAVLQRIRRPRGAAEPGLPLALRPGGHRHALQLPAGNPRAAAHGRTLHGQQAAAARGPQVRQRVLSHPFAMNALTCTDSKTLRWRSPRCSAWARSICATSRCCTWTAGAAAQVLSQQCKLIFAG